MTPAPTPQPPDHGAAGFCTDHAQAADERTETVARAMVVYNRAYDAEFRESGYRAGPHCVKAGVAAAVVATLDDETARLRASADAWWSEYDRELTAHEATRAEVERLSRIVNGYDRTPAEQRAADAEASREQVMRAGQAVARGATARIETLTAERDAACAALDRVRALAEDRRKHGFATGWHSQVHTVVGWDDLCAALDPEEPQACNPGSDALPRERYDAVLDSGPLAPAVGRKCGWCGGPHHDPGDCVVAQRAEAQRLCDEDRRYEAEGGAPR